VVIGVIIIIIIIIMAKIEKFNCKGNPTRSLGFITTLNIVFSVIYYLELHNDMYFFNIDVLLFA